MEIAESFAAAIAAAAIAAGTANAPPRIAVFKETAAVRGGRGKGKGVER